MTKSELVKAFQILPGEAREVLALISGELVIDPTDVPGRFEATAACVRRCYNYPSADELAMSAINELIGGFGTEGIEVDGEFVAEYVNTDDTYSATIVREYGLWGTSEYHLTSWGDWLEAREQENAEA